MSPVLFVPGCVARRLNTLGIASLSVLGLTTTACSKRFSETAVFVEVYAAESAPTPDYLTVTWLNASRPILSERRVPAKGVLHEDAVPLATVAIEIAHAEGDLQRRAFVRGVRDGAEISRGAIRVTAAAGEWVVAQLELSAAPSEDADEDTVPDDIDNCPEQDDLVGCTPSDGGVGHVDGPPVTTDARSNSGVDSASD